MHRDFAVLLYKHLNNKLSEETVHEIIKESVEIERGFICEALPYALAGMNAELMHQYIKFVADHLSVSLGYNTIFGIANPFDWMQMISLNGKDNFFEKRVGEYKKANSMQYMDNGGDSKTRVFTQDEDF